MDVPFNSDGVEVNMAQEQTYVRDVPFSSDGGGD